MILKKRFYCIIFTTLILINHTIQPVSWSELKESAQRNSWAVAAIISTIIASAGILYSYIRNRLTKKIDLPTQPTTKLTTEKSLLTSSSTTSLFATLVQKSMNFAKTTPFPTQANRIQSVANSNPQRMKAIEQDAQNVTIIMHTNVEKLIDDFLAYKRMHGSKKEKALYQNISTENFIKRLIIKRPLMFMTPSDTYLLRDGSKGNGGFENIGTSSEEMPLTLDNYLSYEEMEIAALLNVSVPTYFINNGNRNNNGIKSRIKDFEEHGVYIGAVGARFEKQNVMEWKHIIITQTQNAEKNGYGIKNSRFTFWENFYNTQFTIYDMASKDSTNRFTKINDKFFDNRIYKKRLKMTIEPFLLHANTIAKQSHKKAYCHVVGLGLGVWQLDQKLQAKLMLEVYEEILKEHTLDHISDIDFSWFPKDLTKLGTTQNNQMFTDNGNTIKIHFSTRNPADPLNDDNKGKLLVAMYAWDGNAYPGNEYWEGMLNASGDPAAACCSTIAELQNPLINDFIVSNKPLKYG